MGINKPIYLIIDANNKYYIRKYLSKVESLTSIKQNTLSKHFSLSNNEYKNENWRVIKVINVDLTSDSRGNRHNFIKSVQERE